MGLPFTCRTGAASDRWALDPAAMLEDPEETGALAPASLFATAEGWPPQAANPKARTLMAPAIRTTLMIPSSPLRA
jgi:hypothetical protein